MSKLQRLRDNVAAIENAFRKDCNIRVLAKYTGFGGLNFILNPANKESWNKSDIPCYDDTMRLYTILRMHAKDEQEYNLWIQSLKSSVLTAFYTPLHIVAAIMSNIWTTLQATKDCIKLLDPACGNGEFADWLMECRRNQNGVV